MSSMLEWDYSTSYSADKVQLISTVNTNTELKQLLDKEISPILLKRNLQYDGRYHLEGYTDFRQLAYNKRSKLNRNIKAVIQ